MSQSNPASQSIVLVIHNKLLLKRVTALLKMQFQHYEMVTATSASEGLQAIYEAPPHLMIVDSRLPDISGIQMCRVIKHDPAVGKIPILMIAHQNQAEIERMSELASIADAVVNYTDLEEAFGDISRFLVKSFLGLDLDERHELELIRQESVHVNASTRVVQLFDQTVTETGIMKRFNSFLEHVAHQNILTHLLFSLMEHVLDYDVAGIFFNDKNREPRQLTYHVPKPIRLVEGALDTWTENLFSELKNKSKSPWRFEHTHYDIIHSSELPIPLEETVLKNRTVFPFYIEQELVGALVFYNEKPIHYELIFPFDVLLQQLSALMRLRYYYSEAQSRGILDALTDLYTHQHFTWVLDREIQQAKRQNISLSVAVVGIQNFQHINLQWGYEAGDAALKHLAYCTLQTLRTTDMVARGSGRKLYILLPNTSSEMAEPAFARLAEMLCKTPMSWNEQQIVLNLCYGVVQLQPETQTAMELIQAAQDVLNQNHPEQDEAVTIN